MLSKLFETRVKLTLRAYDGVLLKMKDGAFAVTTEADESASAIRYSLTDTIVRVHPFEGEVEIYPSMRLGYPEEIEPSDISADLRNRQFLKNLEAGLKILDARESA